MGMMVNSVMVTDESGNVFQYGGRKNVFGTFQDATNFADHLRDIHPDCKAYPRRLMRRSK